MGTDNLGVFHNFLKAYPVSLEFHQGVETHPLVDEEAEPGYYEAGPINYSFRLLHDMPTRIAMAGTDAEFVKQLDRFFGYDREPVPELGSPPWTEERSLRMGEGRFDGLNNETMLETPYACVYAGRRDLGPVHTVVDNIRVQEELAYGVARQYDESLDPTDSRQILACWSTPNSSGREAKAWHALSRNGGDTWVPAVLLPPCNIPRFQGRPSYLFRPDGALLLFLTAQPAGNAYDRPVVPGSYDGGRTATHRRILSRP